MSGQPSSYSASHLRIRETFALLRFWIMKIQDEAKEANAERLKEYAADAIDSMVSNVEERNSKILRVYQTGGDALR